MSTKKYIDIMIDLETLSLKPNAAIIDIGAVCSNGKFSAKINPSAYETETQFNVDYNTVEWHRTKNSLNWGVYITYPDRDLLGALGELSDWITMMGGTPVIWANGTSFDIPILEHAYRVYGMEIPWKYYNVRDYRTLREMYKWLVDTVPANANKHVALDDAAHQYDVLKTIFKYLGKELR